MALHSPPGESKLIFAPAGHQAHGQAAQFTLGKLRLRDLDASSPIPQFHAWFSQAQQRAASICQPEACTLSTAALPSGRVSSRVVYLKELDARGFVVYSNLGTSRKACDLGSNPHAALVFYWAALQRQVRVEGVAERNSREESQRYFDTRVRGSRIGAWASRQSEVLEPERGPGGGDDDALRDEVEDDEGGDGGDGDDGRAQLEGWVAEVEKRFEGEDAIPVPEFWGGLRIIPKRVEFWQGRESRLHDRFVYELEERADGKEGGGGGWSG